MGGVEEYLICDNLKSGRIFKPVVAWCIGTCAKMFTSEVRMEVGVAYTLINWKTKRAMALIFGMQLRLI